MNTASPLKLDPELAECRLTPYRMPVKGQIQFEGVQRKRNSTWHPSYVESKKIQMNLLIKQTHRLREWTYGCRGEGWGKAIVREFGRDVYTLLYLEWITSKDLYCTAQEDLLNDMWQPGWEGSLGANGYTHTYIYGWVPLLFTRNYHSTVNQLYTDAKQKVKKK